MRVHDRRQLLKSLLASLLGAPLAGRAAAAPGAAAPLDGRFFLVNGWVLTGRDLAALDPGRAGGAVEILGGAGKTTGARGAGDA